MSGNPICELLQIEYPIFQGAMAWIADGRLAAAVSEAGGLGIIAGGNAPADYVREQIRLLRERSSKPFAVNIMLQSPFAEEIAQLVCEERVPAVTTGAGNPARYMERWKQAGIKVIPVVASTAMAKLMSRTGADALIAEGGESGGHVGELSTMVLLPLVSDVTTLPLIAAGGIGDGRGIAAAWALGASAVQLGTRFLTARECPIHPEYREKILKATDRSTVVTGRTTGHPVRALRTPFTREYEAREYGGAEAAELERLGSGALRKAVQDGDVQEGCFMSGEIAAMFTKTQTAREIIADLVRDAEQRGVRLRGDCGL